MWVAVYTTGNKIQALSASTVDVPTRPTITAVIANPYPPFIMHLDLDKTVGDINICGREGMKGVRYNGSQQIEICAYGFEIDMCRLLQKRLNFNYRIIVSRDGFYGSYNQDTNSSSGIVREIIENNADLALELTETKARSHALWYSKPYMISYIAFIYVKPSTFRDSGIFKPFEANLWLGILASIACVIIFVWTLERFGPYGRYQTNQRSIADKEETFNIFDSITYVWGTYFTGEIIVEKPKSFGSRATITIVSIVAIIVIGAYSANLIAFLIVVDETPPINGLYDERVRV